MKNLNLRGTKYIKKDTFGVANNQGCPPFYDPCQNHWHIWKSAHLINSQDPTALQFVQDPKQENVDNRCPIDFSKEYCSLCHIQRPHVFKMNPMAINTSLIGDDCAIFNDHNKAYDDKDRIFTNRVLADSKKNPVKDFLKPDINSEEYKEAVEKIKTDLLGDEDSICSFNKYYGITPDLELAVRVESEQQMLLRKELARKSVNKDIGTFIEPNITSRAKTHSSIHITSRPNKRRRKSSIFLEKPEITTKGFPHSMVIQEKKQETDITRRGKKIKTILIKKTMNELEAM